MERLTYVDARGRVLFTPSEEVDENPDIGYDIRQIAEYGYREYLSLIAERLANREQYCEMLEGELKTYKDAEEQGLLLRLPCKVGTPVYMVATDCGGDTLDCRRGECEGCPYLYSFVEKNSFDTYMVDDVGKSVFLTKEEAEAALEKMKGE